jgi:hypothetical protein
MEYLRREIAWGSAYAPKSPPSDDDLCRIFRESIAHLGNTIIQAVSLVEETVRICYQSNSFFGERTNVDIQKIVHMRRELVEMDQATRAHLQHVLDNDRIVSHFAGGGKLGLPPQLFNMCLLVVSLLQVGVAIVALRKLGLIRFRADIARNAENSPCCSCTSYRVRGGQHQAVATALIRRLAWRSTSIRVTRLCPR